MPNKPRKTIILRDPEAAELARTGRCVAVRKSNPRLWPLFEASARVNGHVALKMMDGDIPCPFGTPGEVRGVKETWSHTGTGVWEPIDTQAPMDGRFIYKASDVALLGHWWSPTVMPSWAIRQSVVVQPRVEQRDGLWVWVIECERTEAKP
jgi:hypothetical protein